MEITIDWGNKIINIPQDYLTSLGDNVYELNLNTFRLNLKSLEDNEEGMAFPDTHEHVTVKMLSGVTYARFFEIINGYTVTFEDGQYAVNAVGANSNIADVMNLNQVSLRTANSAGLIVYVQGSGLTQTEHDKLMAAAVESGGKLENINDNILSILSDTGFIKDISGGKWEIAGNEMIFYKSDNITEIARFDITRDAKNNPIMRTRQ